MGRLDGKVAIITGSNSGGGAAYVTSKAAVVGLTKHTAMRFAGTGIRCNSVNPSSIATPMAKIETHEPFRSDLFTGRCC